MPSPSFQLQYISDIHLEFHDKQNKGAIQPDMFVKPGAADYLALVGDIGIPELNSMPAFLAWCSQNWKEVFWVPGNHEFYNYRNTPIPVDEKEAYMRTLASRWPNVHYLNREAFELDASIRILGCTLWSFIPTESEKDALLKMNDSKQIKVNNERTAVPSDFNTWHTRDREWLVQEIQRAKLEKKELIVLTHYLPSFRLIHPKYENYPLNCCFATNLESLIQAPVRAWLCGHSHMAVDTTIHSVCCSLNPYGYPGENHPPLINRAKVLSLETPMRPSKESKEEDYEFV